MNIVFLDKGTLGEDIDVSIFSSLGDFTAYPSTPKDLVCKRISCADIVITNKVKLTCELLKQAKSLKLICVTATGYDNIDLEYAKKAGIAVCNVVGYSTESVALVTVSLVLSLCCHIKEYTRYCSEGEYTNSGIQNHLSPVFYELSGKVWGIYGFGNIGKRVASIAEALGCKVIVCKRNKVEDYENVSLQELFEKSDIITVHTPLTQETKNSINEQVLNKAKHGLTLVNAARGAIIDDNALYCAITNGKVANFATDVYSVEPLAKDSPLYSLRKNDNVLFTPHMAWGAYESRKRLVQEIYKNILAFKQGTLRNRVDI